MGKACLAFRATEANMVEVGKINTGLTTGQGNNVK